MASVKRNVIANFAGSAWLALMSLAFIPFYIRLIGVESYGLVGMLITVQAVFAVLDLGLSQTLSRELARLSAHHDGGKRMGSTVRTFEVIYWALALAVTLIVVLLADFLAYQWLNPDHLTRENLREALWIMALVIGLRWPAALYTGGLNGLQRQVLVNTLLAIFATLQSVGALAVLWFIAPTVQCFFWWQAFVALLQVVVLRIALLRSLTLQKEAAFSMEVLKETWRFAAGVTGIALLATLLTQLDKILLSRMLALTDFGYYVFATAVAAVIFRLVAPISTAFTPRLTELVSKNDHASLTSIYHQGCQVTAVAIIAPALTLLVFSREILLLWTRDSVLVEGAYLLVSLLTLGNMLNGLLTIPYALQLAHGWTKLALYINVTAVIFLIPALYLAVNSWGAIGAAGVWIALNCCYILIGMHIMHRRFLPAEKWRWYKNDVGRPLLIVALIVLITRMAVPPDEWGTIATLALVTVALGLGIAAAFWVADTLPKERLFAVIVKKRC